jgi:superfamily II DNA or RNA helicase
MVQDHFKAAFHVGLTATPKRLDGKGLKGHFDFIVLGPKIRWLIEQGYLSDYVAYCRPVPDLSKVATRMGDYAIDELADEMMKARIVGDAVEHYQRLCPGKRAVVFCVNVQHSEVMAQAFRDAGITAASLDGTTELWRRKETVDKFRTGEINVLCNCNLFSEGFDLPAMEAAILLRPTQSLTMYLQQVGRAMRPYPGKERAIILDHAGNVLKHGAPCMEREWTLEPKKKAVQEIHLKVCPQCFAANPIAARTCSECGYVFNEATETVLPDAVDGQLVALTPAQIEEARQAKKKELIAARTMEELVALGTKRQYRNPYYWAQQIMKGRAQWREKHSRWGSYGR